MAMADGGGGSKAQAVREVCAASAAFSACPHRRRQRSPPFVDWYLVLAVADAASEDAVRRRYRQLALQLHPDKNTHAKAELAFKIVSEAHACLTDGARRRAFDDERAESYCAACHDRFRHRAERRTPPATTATTTSTGGARHGKYRGGGGGCGGRRTPVAAQALREVQNRLRDECRVIDSCLKANGGGARRRQSFPLFDPSDRLRFPGYPHTRPPPFAAEFCRFEENLAADRNQRWCGTGAGESPVYQIRTAPERAARTKRHW
uniref:J domain-containing protein n=1 Tax=Oryza glumipatula TaxID=40148 RepID=A0A0D9ZFB4_9ORYZ